VCRWTELACAPRLNGGPVCDDSAAEGGIRKFGVI